MLDRVIGMFMWGATDPVMITVLAAPAGLVWLNTRRVDYAALAAVASGMAVIGIGGALSPSKS